MEAFHRAKSLCVNDTWRRLPPQSTQLVCEGRKEEEMLYSSVHVRLRLSLLLVPLDRETTAAATAVDP